MCHGVSHLDWMEDAPFEKVKEIFDVNLFGVYNVAQAFVRDTLHNAMRKRIIIIGSMAHRAVLNGSAAYCASKAGVAHLARCLAWELAPKGYDVYTIHPSNTLGTPMSHDTIQGLERYRALSHDDALSYWNDSKIRKRSLTVDEIADLVYFLLYSQTGYLSGAQLELGGGQR
jgi:acetoacetyl-CoA reductase/3-oxoacyl-[acyl-carrier protein] reductase